MFITHYTEKEYGTWIPLEYVKKIEERDIMEWMKEFGYHSCKTLCGKEFDAINGERK